MIRNVFININFECQLDKDANFFILKCVKVYDTFDRDSRVAQLVEQVAVNHLVAGSSPAAGVSVMKQIINSSHKPPDSCN